MPEIVTEDLHRTQTSYRVWLKRKLLRRMKAARNRLDRPINWSRVAEAAFREFLDGPRPTASPDVDAEQVRLYRAEIARLRAGGEPV